MYRGRGRGRWGWAIVYMSAMLSRLTTARFCARPWNRCVRYISLRICTFLNIKHRHGIPTHHSEAPNYLELQEGLKFPFPLHDAHPPFMHPSFLEFSRASESQNAVEDEQSFSLGKKSVVPYGIAAYVHTSGGNQVWNTHRFIYPGLLVRHRMGFPHVCAGKTPGSPLRQLRSAGF